MAFYTFCDKVGSKIFHRYVDDDGRRHQRIVTDFPIQLFIKGQGDAVSLYGDRLVRRDFTDIKEASEFLRRMKDVSPVYGQTSLVHQFLAHKYPGIIEFDFTKYRVLNFDIETRFDGYDPDDECTVRRVFSNETEVVFVEHMRTLDHIWEVYDKYNDRWYNCGTDHPLKRAGGFPDPNKAEYEVTSISCKLFGRKKRVAFGLKDYEVKCPDLMYVKCDDEVHLLKEFIAYVRAMDPDALTGWNIEGFDIPYLVNRIGKVVSEAHVNKLSPFHAETSKCVQEYFDKGSEEPKYRILGVTTLDYLELYKKFNLKKQEQYSLDFIAEVELGENKLDYSEFANLMDLYHRDFQRYIDYNDRDTELVERLDQKKQFIRLALTTVLMTKSRYQEVMGKVKLWDNLIYNMLLEENVVIPPVKVQRGERIHGAFVKEPRPAKYRYVASLDLTSLYPSICMMYNMSPETMVRGEQGTLDYVSRLLAGEDLAADARENGCAMAANGSVFSLDSVGVLPKAMRYVFDTRKAYKNQMLAEKSKKEDYIREGGKDQAVLDAFENKIAALDAAQNAMKILANSGYGVTAQNSFRYYSRDIAQGITLTGQLTIQYIVRETNKFLNERFNTNRDFVITADTDSMYLELDLVPSDHKNVEQSIQEMDDFIEKELQPYIDQRFKDLSDRMGCPENKMDMKREALSDVGIWRAKKHYILQVYDMEGVRYATPDLKIMGIEVARSDKPKIVREELKKCIKIMLTGTNDELIAELRTFRKHWDKIEYDAIAKPMGVSNMDADFETCSVYNTKAALLHNLLLVEKGVHRKYNRIRAGSRIKLLMLKQPNPARNNYIAYVGELPEEFGLHQYIDRDKMYETQFLSPVKSLTSIIGWETEKVNTLESLFG